MLSGILHRWRSSVRRALLVAAIAGALTAGQTQALELTIEGNKIVASGLSPGARVAWLATLRSFDEDRLNVRNLHTEITDSNNDGTVLYDLGTPIPEISVWAAVEVGTGAAAVLVPDSDERQERVFPPGSLAAQAGSGPFDLLAYPAAQLLALWVRPSNGTSFLIENADGSGADFDGLQDTVATAQSADASPLVPGTDVPPSFATGDVLVVLDPITLEFSVTQVPSNAP